MANTIVDAESVLAIDIGSVNTRALLFDVAGGQYRFVGSAMSPTTFQAPMNDVSEGVQFALDRLEEVSGRRLVDNDFRLIIPSQTDGTGVDRLVITFSIGSELNFVTVGLLPEVSLESANHLAESTYGRVVESIGLTDRRRPGSQVDAIVKASPDLIILAGGTENGATRSMNRLAELITMACRVIPTEKMPQVMYAGNTALGQKIKDSLTWYQVTAHIAPNVRPGIDQEDLGPARELMAQMVGKIRTRQVQGLSALASHAHATPVPSSHAVGRILRYLSEFHDPNKGVMGVDLGASWTTIAAAVGGRLSEIVVPVGMGTGMQNVLKLMPLEEILQWLPVNIPAAVVRDYLWQKTLAPDTIPMSVEALEIEHAVARQVLRKLSDDLLLQMPGMTMSFEPIIVGGSTLTNVPTPEKALMVLLDGLQPVGITTFIMDPYGLTPALGAAANVNSQLPVQVFESNAYLNLATVISPLSPARPGTVIMRAHLEDDMGQRTSVEVKQGSMALLPLHHGQVGKVYLEPSHRTVIDPRRQQATSFKVVGGVLGVVVDARGRPLALPPDAARRRDLFRRWTANLETGKLV